jgi:predicted nuclease of restriction endonuclease-like (RecB) superfamily
LSWSHYIELIWFDDINKIQYYINLVEKYNLSVRELRNRIKSSEYERLPEDTKKILDSNTKSSLVDLVKDPIIIKNNNILDDISEKALHLLILEDIPSFLKELGSGFTFIDHEYKIIFNDRYNYIDFLLFNIDFNCYVVVEIKITELKKEHIGQIQTYINYIDKNIKKITHDNTIGIIICKKDNKFIMQYCSDDRILSREYTIE